ncbi:MAG: hypothetical protein M3P06_22690 [Acidobacteriota bacterium]|nr:hypothetical protein [Acidobacteriota bacterium]
MSDNVNQRVRAYHQELFDTFDEFFRGVTGFGADRFQGFSDLSVSTWDTFVTRFNKAAEKLESRLAGLYNEHRHRQFNDARALGGVKMVLGGGSRFYGTQREAVVRTALYADTILVPDPVYAWLEVKRHDVPSVAFEVFKTIHSLLLLRPLVDTPSETMPIVLFPSFEKALEQNDPTTQQAMNELVTAYLNAGLNRAFGSMPEVFDAAGKSPEQFIADVSAARLFIPRGHDAAPDDARDAIREYREEVLAHRTGPERDAIEGLNDAEVLALAIFESVAPQFHLFENSTTLAAQPLMCFPNHWHYYRTLSTGVHSELTKSGLLSSKTIALVQALQQERFGWLSGVTVDQLAALRETSEFRDFRSTLEASASALEEVQLSDIDRVGAEVAAALGALLDKHDLKGRHLVEQFKTKHSKTAVMAGAAVAVTFLPALASVISGVGAFGVLTRYIFDKIDEKQEKAALTRSLIGVLANARDVASS